MQYSQILKPENRVILISGVSSGIGLAIAKYLLNEGYSLSLGVRNIEKTIELLSKCKSQNYIINKFEATELKTIDSWVDNTIKRFGCHELLSVKTEKHMCSLLVLKWNSLRRNVLVQNQYIRFSSTVCIVVGKN